MNAALLQTALRQTQASLSSPRLYAVFGIVVLVFAVSGPFGTYEAYSLPHRLGIWFLLHAATWVTAIFSLNILGPALTNTFPNLWLRLIVCATLAGIPVSLVTMAMEQLFRGYRLEWNFENWLLALSSAVPLTLAFSILSTLTARSDNDGRIASSMIDGKNVPSNLAQPKLLARLPLAKRGTLISLSAADHYVEVVTTNGSCLILMRLADAVAEAAPVEGNMIHRSHWVALSAIAGLKGSIGQAKLQTTDGRILPVSRAATPEIRAILARRAS